MEVRTLKMKHKMSLLDFDLVLLAYLKFIGVLKVMVGQWLVFQTLLVAFSPDRCKHVLKVQHRFCIVKSFS